MADYAVVQQVNMGGKLHFFYVNIRGTVVPCFADSSKSCGKDFSSVADAHYKLMLAFPVNHYEMVTEGFIGKEFPDDKKKR